MRGAALGPLGLLGTDRISGPFSSSVNRFTADGIGGLISDVSLQPSTLTYQVNDVCLHELHVSAGPVGMSDALGMDPTACASPSILVFGTWRIVPEPSSPDFDGDGDVDGDDFLTWQASFGIDAGGDADADGDTDGDDFLIWQSEFGPGSSSASAAVPEPHLDGAGAPHGDYGSVLSTRPNGPAIALSVIISYLFR